MTMMLTYDMGPMSQIHGRLYLGTLHNAKNLHLENPKRITHVLNCTADDSIDFLEKQSDITVMRLDHQDGFEYPTGKVWRGLEFIRKSLISGGTVLVCCHAGMSRSPGMVMAHLYTSGMKMEEAVHTIKAVRPFIQIHNKIDLSIRKALGLAPMSAADLLQAKDVKKP